MAGNETAIVAFNAWIQSCIAAAPDNVLQSHTGASDGSDVDAAGNPVPPDAPALINPDTGDIYCLNKGDVEIAAADGSFTAVDGSTVNYSNGDRIITLDNGERFCVPPKKEDPFFEAGEVLPSTATDVTLSDGSVIGAGDTVPAGEQVGFYGETILCLTKPVNSDTHSVVTDVFDPTNPPTAPINPPINKSEGATHVEKMSCGVCFYKCVGGVWQRSFCCITLDKKPPSYCGLTSAALDDSLIEPESVELVAGTNQIVFTWAGGDTLTVEHHDIDPARPPIVGGIGFPIFYFTEANTNSRFTAIFEYGDDCEVDGCKPVRKLDLQMTDTDFPGTVMSLNDITTGTLANVFNNSGALQPTGNLNEWEVLPGFGNTPQFENGVGFVVNPADGHLFEGFGSGAPAPGSSSEGVVFFARLFRRDPVAIDSCTGEALDKNGDVVADSDYELVKGCC